MKKKFPGCSRLGTLVLASVFLVCCLAAVSESQTRPSRPPSSRSTPSINSGAQYKGIWEPVNFNADVKLFDALFTTAHEGWVAGGKDELHGGIILHTMDGGKHWEVAYGDPESSERAVTKLRFLDRTHGWAIQGTGSASRLLHTSDGQNWVMAGTIAEHAQDYMFTSESSGVAVQNARILLTGDGGRTWKQTAQCQATVQVRGLARNVRCEWVRLQFLTPSLGYAVAFSYDQQARNIIFLAKTTDSGASWNMITSEATDHPQDAFFLDENTGYVRVGAPDTGQIFKTTDGGQTWVGMAASPGDHMLFADPEVGWAVHGNKISFTTNGGNRWNSREYPFPAPVRTFSLPRRDRGYVVGDHGMIYRYRIVRGDYTAAGMILAPLLSGIDSPLDDQVEKLAAQIRVMTKQAGAPADAGNTADAFASGGDTAATDGGAADTDALTQPAPPVSDGNAFTQDVSTGSPAGAGGSGGFIQEVSQTQATVDAIVTTAPQFVSKYRNLNLLLAGFNLATQMPNQVQQLKQSFSALKGVRDPQAAAATLTTLQTQVTGLLGMVRNAFQKR